MRVVKAGTADVSVVIRIIDSTDGTPETGVVWNSAGIDLQYRREGAVSTTIVEATLAALTDAHSDGGFLHIGNGYYRFDLPDAACAAGVTGVLIHGTVTGMVVIGEYIQLVTYDPFDAVRLGLTALPNAAADAAGGLPISDAGGLDLDTKLANTNEVTVARMGALTDWINGGRLDLILDIIAADVVNLDGAAMRGTDSAALASVCTEARLAELDAANLPTDVAAVKTDTGNLVTRITATLFSGITSLAEWLGLLAGKQVGNATALTEIKATGAGAGTFSETTDSLEAIRDTAPLGTAMRGTDSAALASVCTETRLAELDAANLPTTTDNILTDTGTTLPAQITALNNISAAQVNAEVVDALNTDTYAEPGQGAPGTTISLAQKLGYLFKAWRNKATQTATQYSLYADDTTTLDHKATVSDDGTTATRGEVATGP